MNRPSYRQSYHSLNSILALFHSYFFYIFIIFFLCIFDRIFVVFYQFFLRNVHYILFVNFLPLTTVPTYIFNLANVTFS